MSYFGAYVLHPKTLIPLGDKNIPIFVKSVLELEKSGTLMLTRHSNITIFSPAPILALH